MHVKRFLEWIGLKERLHCKFCKAPYVNEGDIWWASVGENIGSEINGKSNLFSRPVIIFKKLSHNLFFVVPATIQGQKGSWFVEYKQNGISINACLHQVRSIDYRRFYSKLGELDDKDFARIKEGFRNLYL